MRNASLNCKVKAIKKYIPFKILQQFIYVRVADMYNVCVCCAEEDTRSETRTYRLRYEKLFLKGLLFYKLGRKEIYCLVSLINSAFFSFTK